MSREPAPQAAALPPAPTVVAATPAKEPVLLSELPEKPVSEKPAAASEVVPQYLESSKPQVVSPKMVGPPLPVETVKPTPEAEPAGKPEVKPEPKTDPVVTPKPSPKPEPKPEPKAEPKPASKLINVNTATAAELELLPDIGPSLAKRIIEYREKHGRFEKLADLDKVSGIGPKTLEKLKDRVAFR